jgi:hypothetical protein
MHPYVVSLFSIVDHLFKKKWGRFGSDCRKAMIKPENDRKVEDVT